MGRHPGPARHTTIKCRIPRDHGLYLPKEVSLKRKIGCDHTLYPRDHGFYPRSPATLGRLGRPAADDVEVGYEVPGAVDYVLAAGDGGVVEVHGVGVLEAGRLFFA